MENVLHTRSCLHFYVFCSCDRAVRAKITAGAPVFIGESNLDISKALNGCHSIAWWQNSTNTSAPPEKNITLYEINSVSEIIYHYNISPNVFTGYTGDLVLYR